MKKTMTRVVSLMLIFVLSCTVLPITGQEAQAASNINDILNSQELHPQKTGYAALDALVEQVLAPYANASTADKVKASYDYCVRDINYSWAGYTAKNSGYSGFNYAKNAYPYSDYDDTLIQAFPQEIIDRTYYTMANHKGVCYDYGVVFAVLMRAIGLNAYVHTGIFTFEEQRYGNLTGHHGWAEVQLSGTNYIFDPQREYRMCGDGTGTIDYSRYYGLLYSETYRYRQETSINAARDAGFLPVETNRRKQYTVTANSSASGTVSGSGAYDMGTEATVTATPNEGGTFAGWYDEYSNLLSTDAVYTFTATTDTTVYARFENDLFFDIPAGSWYLTDAERAAKLNVVNGMNPYQFRGNETMTRGMIITILARYAGVDFSSYTETKFTDVDMTQYYGGAIAWAGQTGVVEGTSATTFEPNAAITREQFLKIIVSYLEKNMYIVPYGELTYSDAADTSDWAFNYAQKAQGAGLIKGFEDNSYRPRETLTRAQGVTFLMRMIDVMPTLSMYTAEQTPAQPAA